MKLKQIKTAYANLELIIHKKKYLIPNKPIRPLSLYLKFSSSEKDLIKQYQNNLKASLSHQKPISNLSIRAQSIKQLINNNHPAYIKIKTSYQKQLDTYKALKKQYDQKYIKPAEYYKKSPYMYLTSIYYKNYKEEGDDLQVTRKKLAEKWQQIKTIRKEMVQMEMVNQKKEVLSDMEQFTVNFFKEYQKAKEKELKMYQDYVEKHEIPERKRINGINQFLNERASSLNLAGQFESGHFQDYKAMSEEQKDIYEKNAQMKNKLDRKKYQAFLQKWNITHQKLESIKVICDEYEKIKDKTVKQAKKVIDMDKKKGLKIEHPDDDQQP